MFFLKHYTQVSSI